jgi:hypothetical protein
MSERAVDWGVGGALQLSADTLTLSTVCIIRGAKHMAGHVHHVTTAALLQPLLLPLPKRNAEAAMLPRGSVQLIAQMARTATTTTTAAAATTTTTAAAVATSVCTAVETCQQATCL